MGQEHTNEHGFTLESYTPIIADLIGDKYAKISNRGKMQFAREFSEVIVKKILNIEDKQMMLGSINRSCKKELKQLDLPIRNLLINTAKNIARHGGNDGIHTQHKNYFSDDDVMKMNSRMFDLYSILFINYFHKYPLNICSESSLRAVYYFSLLPPIIRHKTLRYLFNKDSNNKNNVQVINKLLLVKIKTYSKKRALKWMELNKSKIMNSRYPNDEEKMKYYTTCGRPVKIKDRIYYIVSLMFDNYDNMYDLLMDKIKDPQTSINEGGKMYSDFESAVNYYRSPRVQSTISRIALKDKEINEMKGLMDFCYCQRRSQ